MRLTGLLMTSCCLFIWGCPGADPGPNPNEVLAGEWDVTPDDPGDFDGVAYRVTFNADGDLTEILATRLEDGATARRTVTGAVTEVNGSTP
ncbi:MAG: hypothetical protein ACYTHJ_16705 [Planctomycetota bacterium]